MSNSSNGNSGKASGGIEFFGVLQLILITLKLCKVITWSWWLVLLPIWIGIGLTASGLPYHPGKETVADTR